MDEMDNIVVLNDELGNERRFEFLDFLEYSGNNYVILLPIEEFHDEPEMIVILKLEESEESDVEQYVSVEDEDVLNAVFELFKKRFEEFDYCD